MTLAPVLCSFLFVNKKEETETIVDRIMKQRYLRDARVGFSSTGTCCSWRWARCLPSPSGSSLTSGASSCRRWRRGTCGSGRLLPRTVSLREAARMAPRLREVMASIPEIRAVMSHVGRPDDGTDVTSYLQPRVQRPLEADGTSGGRSRSRSSARSSGSGPSPAKRSRTR